MMTFDKIFDLTAGVLFYFYNNMYSIQCARVLNKPGCFHRLSKEVCFLQIIRKFWSWLVALVVIRGVCVLRVKLIIMFPPVYTQHNLNQAVVCTGMYPGMHTPIHRIPFVPFQRRNIFHS